MDTVIVDQSGWGVVSMTGADRVRFLQGMVVGDVAALGAGQWLRTAMLSPKGRVVAIFDVAAETDALVLICQPGHREGTVAALSRYAIMDDVEFTPTERAVHRVWSDPAAVWTAPPVWAAHEAPSDEAAVERRRIEAGLPLYGVDISDANFPFESTLSRLINYEKGCYVGQEPVHRVHAKGQGQKMLRGLRFAEGAPPALGSVVSHRDRKEAGVVTSSVQSPDFGTIALTTLHRTAYEPGDTVTCDAREATIAELPLQIG